jgi:co-chaperonin GroES (HSP10)
MSKLDDRRKQYGIPSLVYMPRGKTVVVWRLPADEKTAGGLYIPGVAEDVKSRGILLACGLAARDLLGDDLIEVGDEVYFKRFSAVEREVGRAETKTTAKLLEMAAEDILGSSDVLDRVKDYEITTNDDGDSIYVPKRKAS